MAEKICGEPAQFRYTWPGKEEAYCCIDHAAQLQKISNAIGMKLQLINLDGPLALKEDREQMFCSSKVEE